MTIIINNVTGFFLIFYRKYKRRKYAIFFYENNENPIYFFETIFTNVNDNEKNNPRKPKITKINPRTPISLTWKKGYKKSPVNDP